MRYAHRLTVIGLAAIAAGLTAAGCATPWFGNRKPEPAAPSRPVASDDQKSAAAAYINGLCKLPREQRDMQVRELNEAVLPNHATISCGPGSADGP
jgi:hypothetical protein